MLSSFNKDFYAFIPIWMQNKLDMKILLYGKEGWFSRAWDTYRKKCLTFSKDDPEDPDIFFAKAEGNKVELVASDDDGVIFSESDEYSSYAKEDLKCD